MEVISENKNGIIQFTGKFPKEQKCIYGKYLEPFQEILKLDFHLIEIISFLIVKKLILRSFFSDRYYNTYLGVS